MQTAVLFDLDGVIINTEGQYTAFWKKVGDTYLPHLTDFAQCIKGHTLKQIFNEFFANDAELQQQIVGLIDDFEQKMNFPYVKGAIDFVKSLHQAGYVTAVVTSSNLAKMACLYKQHPELPQLFDRIFTAEDAQRSKPAPDCYIHAAKTLGFDAKDCFVFEDSISGLIAGHDSGATVIGLTTTNSADSIKKFCQLTIHNFNEINVAQMCNLKHI